MRQDRYDDWSRQEFSLFIALTVCALVFMGALFYALNSGRSDLRGTDTAWIAPQNTGEKIPVVPVIR